MASKTEARDPAASAVVTANRLRDGRVVWLTAAHDWAEDFAEAALFAGMEIDAGLERALADERRQIVVAAYAVDVARTADGPTPVKCRERVRAVGPSVRRDLGLRTPAATRLAL